MLRSLTLTALLACLASGAVAERHCGVFSEDIQYPTDARPVLEGEDYIQAFILSSIDRTTKFRQHNLEICERMAGEFIYNCHAEQVPRFEEPHEDYFGLSAEEFEALKDDKTLQSLMVADELAACRNASESAD